MSTPAMNKNTDNATDKQKTVNSGDIVDESTATSLQGSTDDKTVDKSDDPKDNLFPKNEKSQIQQVTQQTTPVSVNNKEHAPRLAYRHKIVADRLLTETDKTPTQIVKEVYGHTKTTVASVQANRLLNNANVQAYLELHGSKAVEQINEISNEVLRRARVASDRDSAPLYNIAMTGKKDIADRALGRATQRTEQVSTGVTLTIDLTSALSSDENN